MWKHFYLLFLNIFFPGKLSSEKALQSQLFSGKSLWVTSFKHMELNFPNLKFGMIHGA